MTHTLHQLAQARSRRSRKCIAGMAQIMKVDVGQANALERLRPDTAKVATPQCLSLRAYERQAFVSSLCEAFQMLPYVRHDRLWNGD